MTTPSSRDGCTDSLKVWRTDTSTTLLDGHNRLEICDEQNIAYRVEPIGGIVYRDDAILWILLNQLGRRNLSGIDMIATARKAEPMIAAKARERMLAGTAPDPMVTLPQGVVGSTRAAAAKLANTSEQTYVRGCCVLDEAGPEAIARIRNKESTINNARRTVVYVIAYGIAPKPGFRVNSPKDFSSLAAATSYVVDNGKIFPIFPI